MFPSENTFHVCLLVVCQPANLPSMILEFRKTSTDGQTVWCDKYDPRFYINTKNLLYKKSRTKEPFYEDRINHYKIGGGVKYYTQRV